MITEFLDLLENNPEGIGDFLEKNKVALLSEMKALLNPMGAQIEAENAIDSALDSAKADDKSLPTADDDSNDNQSLDDVLAEGNFTEENDNEESD